MLSQNSSQGRVLLGECSDRLKNLQVAHIGEQLPSQVVVPFAPYAAELTRSTCRQRKAIVAGLRESVSGHPLVPNTTLLAVCSVQAAMILLSVDAVQVTNFSSDVTDINSRDVIELMLITQVRSGMGPVGFVFPLPQWPLSVLSCSPVGMLSCPRG